MNKEDAHRVMKTLLVLRGIDKPRSIEAWDEGGLEVAPGSIKLQGVAQKWRSKVEQGEKWNLDKKQEARLREDGAEKSCVKKGAIVAFEIGKEMRDGNGDREVPVDQPSKLKEILCCRCNRSRRVENSKLFTKTGFSTIKCGNSECGKTAVSDRWNCRCMIPWIKCPRHIHIASMIKRKPETPQAEKRG